MGIIGIGGVAIINNGSANTNPDGDNTPVYFANCATPSALPTCTYNNGTSGVGATLTANANGALTTTYTDAVALSVGLIILVWKQSSALQNGIYEVTQIGTVSTPWILTRLAIYDTTSEVYPSQVNILGGNTYANLYFLQQTASPTIGTSSIVYQTATAPTGTTINQNLKLVDTYTSSALPTCTYTPNASATTPALNAYLNATSNGVFPTLNGVVPFQYMKVLVYGQADQTQNGDYILQNVGSASSTWRLSRISYTASALYPAWWGIYSGTGRGLIFEQTTSTLTTATIGVSGNIVFVQAGGSTGGIFGISNSTGVYTYYATLTLAMASASSGQTIEFFANYTETGNVPITFKDNVNINGNGYTYTCTNNTSGLSIFYAPTGSRTISNLTLVGSGVASNCTGFQTNAGNTTCFNFVVKMDAGTGALTYTGGIIDGITCRVTGNSTGIFVNGGYVLNSRAYSVSGYGINCSVGNGSIYNCHSESTSSSGIYGGFMRKCVGIGAGAGIWLQGGGGATDCTGISSSGYGIYITGSSGLHSNLVAISTGSWALRVFAPSIVINGFSVYSSASYGFVGFTDTIASNGYAESTVAIPFASDGGTFTNVYSKCSWNNAGGHAFLTAGTTAELINCTLQVANASANCINSATAKTVKYIRSTFKGATTPVNANITQGQTNTEDNQGNILVN
jgi:hypothetical protein